MCRLRLKNFPRRFPNLNKKWWIERNKVSFSCFLWIRFSVNELFCLYYIHVIYHCSFEKLHFTKKFPLTHFYINDTFLKLTLKKYSLKKALFYSSLIRASSIIFLIFSLSRPTPIKSIFDFLKPSSSHLISFSLISYISLTLSFPLLETPQKS